MLRLLLLAALAAGCASQPLPPVVDLLDMPPTATLDTATSSYLVSGSLQHHDPDDLVQTLRVEIPLTMFVKDYPIGLYSGVVSPLNVRFGMQTPKGTQRYTLTLIDASGLETVAQKTVTLE